MKELKFQNTKQLNVRKNGRSADAITPNFIYGCGGGCSTSYCYVERWDRPYIYVNENVDDILEACNAWVETQPWPKIPNQTDSQYYTLDIGCSTDVCLHWKNYNWIKIFEWFKAHPKLKATFATKYVNNNLLKFNSNQKVRIRFSLLPQIMSSILEPNTSNINIRINAIKRFQNAGYDVHLNFSPIVLYKGWIDDYKVLLQQIVESGSELTKIGLECIFLTHNKQQHERNIKCGNFESEKLIWTPELQENKVSEYGGHNVRYNHKVKPIAIKTFTNLLTEYLPMCQIRYIF